MIPLKWTVWWQGSANPRGAYIFSVNRFGQNVEQIMYAGEDNDLAHEICRKHNDTVDALRSSLRETFKGTIDTDTPLQAAAREAGWALTELIDGIDWQKRDHVSLIIAQLGLALNTPELSLGCIVPDHCTGSALVFVGGCLHVRKDGSGYLVVDEGDFQLEDDRGEGPDGPEGSVHWIARFPPEQMTGLRDFLNKQPFSARTGQSSPAGDPPYGVA